MITLTPRYKKHSEYLGHTIYKRQPNTGTHGGMWVTDSVLFKSLSRVKAYLEFYYSHNQ